MLIRYLIIAAGNAIVTALRAIGSALYQPDDGERVSTWSIRKRDARAFYLLLTVLWIGAAAGLAWSQYDPAPPRVLQWATLPPHPGDGSVYVVIQRFGVVVIPLMAAALLLTPATVGIGRLLMAIARFINDKILEPYVESKAIAPRMAVREAELQEKLQKKWQARIQDNDAQWAAWIERRDAALAQGQEFNEPRPDAARD